MQMTHSEIQTANLKVTSLILWPLDHLQPSHSTNLHTSTTTSTNMTTNVHTSTPGPTVYVVSNYHQNNQQGQQYFTAPQNSPFAVLRNLPPPVEKRGIAHFLLQLYLIQGFLGSIFTFTIYKTIKSSCCKLTFMIIMTNLRYFHQ